MFFKLAVFLLIVSPAAWAAKTSGGQGLLAYEKGDYESAAAMFYSALSDKSKLGQEEAQFRFAESLKKLDLRWLALQAFLDIAKNSEHDFFRESLEQIETLSDELNADFLITEPIERLRQTGLKLPDGLSLALAEFHFKTNNLQLASLLANQTGADSRAQYLLGLIALAKKEDDFAMRHFAKADSALGRLALARLHYERAFSLAQEDPKRLAGFERAIGQYLSIPRFTQQWDQSLLERAWVYSAMGQHGKALGALYSFEQPYFQGQFWPEVDVIRAINYWYVCQWDHVGRALRNLRAVYAPIQEQLQKWLEKNGGWETLPKMVQRRLNSQHTMDLFSQLGNALGTEWQTLDRLAKLRAGELGRVLKDQLRQIRENLASAKTQWIRREVLHLAKELGDNLTRTTLISIDTKTAEAEWLQDGKKIEGRARKRLERPAIVAHQNEFWWVKSKENFLDELGYYEFNVKSECYE